MATAREAAAAAAHGRRFRHKWLDRC
jgi:hypothetical protein